MIELRPSDCQPSPRSSTAEGRPADEQQTRPLAVSSSAKQQRGALIAGRTGPDRQIDLREHAFGLAVVSGMTAERGSDGVGRQCAGDPLLGRPTDRRRQQAVGQAEPIVERPADLLGLGRPAGQVPAVQQRRDGGQLAPLQPLGGGDLLLQFRAVDRRPQQHFAFQVGRQPAGDHFQDVRLPVVEVAPLGC